MSLTHEEWTDALRDGDVLGVTCTDCNATYGTPFVVCNECGSRDMATTTLPTDGEVYSETTIRVPPVAFDGPYQVGTVQLDEARVTARLRGEVRIGDRVVFDGILETNGEVAPVFRTE